MERNSKLFNEVADAIEWEDTIKYDQTVYVSNKSEIGECGTRACIAGFAVGIKDYKRDWFRMWIDNHHNEIDINTRAQNLLGLSNHESACLFSGDWKPTNDMTVPEVLRKMGEGHDLYDLSNTGREWKAMEDILVEY